MFVDECGVDVCVGCIGGFFVFIFVLIGYGKLMYGHGFIVG